MPINLNRLLECIDHPVVHSIKILALLISPCEEPSSAKENVPQLFGQPLYILELRWKFCSNILKCRHIPSYFVLSHHKFLYTSLEVCSSLADSYPFPGHNG